MHVDKWFKALIREIDFWKNDYSGFKVETLYFGGGSPNLIDSGQYVRMIESLKTAFDMSELMEFTVETNPVKHDREFLTQLKNTGVDRLNVGVQSFNDNELQTLGRIHNVADVIEMFETLKEVGFKHIGLDLIYGISGQSMEIWQDSLRCALDTGADHLSLYNLSYEEGTPLTKLLKQGRINPIEDEVEKQMYLKACHELDNSGFNHYEISNWARPDCESRHNRAYWEGKQYLGLGPSAHSFDRKSRWWNFRSIDNYIKLVDKGQLPIDYREELTEQDREIEHLFLRLRTSDGLLRSQFENLFMIDFKRIIDKLTKLNFAEKYWLFDGESFKFTPGGWFVSDSIIYTILSSIEEIRNDHKKG